MSNYKKIRSVVNDSEQPNQRNRTSLKGPKKVRKKIILGEKFDYGEKAKERKNYILYISGQMQEKKEIFEIIEPPTLKKLSKKKTEEKKLIDNYQYHETRDLKRNNSKQSSTFHQRLSTPFERRQLRKYLTISTTPKKRIKTSFFEDKRGDFLSFGERNKYNSNTYNSRSLNIKKNNGFGIYDKNSKPKNYYKEKNNNNIKEIKTYEYNNRTHKSFSNYGKKNVMNKDRDVDTSNYKKN